jgi:hypothetical protein
VPEHFLYALRNAEVISSAAARKSDRGTVSQRTTVRLSGEQLLEIQALPPAAVEILVVGSHAFPNACRRALLWSCKRRPRAFWLPG